MQKTGQIFLNAKIVKERQTCLLSGAGVNLERYAVADYPAGNVVKFLFIGRSCGKRALTSCFRP